jgi:hypothetical protein
LGAAGSRKKPKYCRLRERINIFHIF